MTELTKVIVTILKLQYKSPVFILLSIFRLLELGIAIPDPSFQSRDSGLELRYSRDPSGITARQSLGPISIQYTPPITIPTAIGPLTALLTGLQATTIARSHYI